MAVEISVEPRHVRVAFSGPVTVQVIRQAIDGLRAHPDFDRTRPRVWDFSDSTGISGLTAGELGALSMLGSANEPAATRAAVIVATDHDFGVARMFEGRHGSELAVELRVFRDRAAGEAWVLGESRPGPGDP